MTQENRVIEKEANEYATLYRKLGSVKAVARYLNCSVWKVKTRLQAAGVDYSFPNITKYKIPRNRLLDIAKKLKDGIPVNDIAKQYGVSRQRIYQLKDLFVYKEEVK